MRPALSIKAPRLVVVMLLLIAGVVRADAPSVDHQPSPCTVPDKAISICATVTDDGQVAKARVYFRSAGDKFYSFVDMAFGGLSFCGTVPAPRGGKVKSIDYYVWAVDEQYETQRTSTFQMVVQAEAVCEFPPVEKDPARASSIVVHATHPKQGKKLPEEFEGTGVSFVPVTGNR